jgi:hypothetical protein
MTLRKSIFLKFFALLLFTFELLAPVYLTSRVEGQENETNQLQLHTTTPLGFFASLLYEEAGNEEEREGKEHQKVFNYVAEVNFLAVFSCRAQLDDISYADSFTRHTPTTNSLNTLYSVFRI